MFCDLCYCYYYKVAGLHTGFWGGGRGDLTDDLRMYMRRCHTYILVNKSHNAVITNFLFACVCNHIICAVYITCILLWNSGGGGGGGRDPSAPPPPLYATLINLKIDSSNLLYIKSCFYSIIEWGIYMTLYKIITRYY